MPGCVAVNCTNHSDRGFRLFLFPRDPQRRAKWVQNCRRDKWAPTNASRLCEQHFELCQFEQNRADGNKKLKPNAIPTIFSVPNPPPPIGMKRILKERNLPIASTSVINVEEPHNSDSNIVGTSANDENNAQDVELKKVQRALWRTQKQVLRLQKQLRHSRELLEKIPFLSSDLINHLLSGKKKAPWTPLLIKKAVQIRFAVGWKGYKYLVSNHFPLPSYRTLCRHVSTLNFNPGILLDILPLLKEKTKQLQHSQESHCVLVLDEMDIKTGLQFDKANDTMMGYSTVTPDTGNLAAQLVVFILRGVSSNWKQVVAWHLTSKKKEGDLYTFMKQLIVAVEGCGYNVRAVTSDMGPKNRAMWKQFGVKVGRKDDICYIQHPCRSDTKLYFCADVPHLLKNLRNALITHDIVLPQSVVQKETLPTNKVSFNYVKQLFNIQKRYKLSLVPQLSERALNPMQFEKMKVSLAAYVISYKTASALETLVKLERISKKALTTAWFIRTIRKWFDILNSRTLKCAITKKNRGEKCRFLNSIISLMREIKIGSEGIWKPVQTGIILSTNNIIELSYSLLAEGQNYVLTSRFNQDCIENLFSIVRRHGNINPTALQAVRSLKLITIAQFVGYYDRAQNYDEDTTEHFIDVFAKKRPAQKFATVTSMPINKCLNGTELVADEEPIELEHVVNADLLNNALNNLLGSALNSAIKKKKLCTKCISIFRNTKSSGREEEIFIEALNVSKLNFPSMSLFDTFQIFNVYIDRHLLECTNHSNMVKHLMHFVLLCHPQPPSCAFCRGVNGVLEQFIFFKLNISATAKNEQKKIAKKKVKFGSKSAYINTRRM